MRLRRAAYIRVFRRPHQRNLAQRRGACPRRPSPPRATRARRRPPLASREQQPRAASFLRVLPPDSSSSSLSLSLLLDVHRGVPARRLLVEPPRRWRRLGIRAEPLRGVSFGAGWWRRLSRRQRGGRSSRRTPRRARLRGSPWKSSNASRSASSRVVATPRGVFFATDAHEPSDSDASENPSTSAKNCFCCSSLVPAPRHVVPCGRRRCSAAAVLVLPHLCAFFLSARPPQSPSLSSKGPW